MGAQQGIMAQILGEGSGANWNPLDTTEPMPGDSLYNSVGVRNYPTMWAGWQATIKTLTNGYYPQVISALQRGSSSAYVQAIARSPWGTWSNVSVALSYLHQIQSNLSLYSSKLIAGSTGEDDENMAYLVQQPGQAGVWVVASDFTSKVPLETASDESALLAQGVVKINLSEEQLAVIPTVEVQ